jgi:hypothetical protein
MSVTTTRTITHAFKCERAGCGATETVSDEFLRDAWAFRWHTVALTEGDEDDQERVLLYVLCAKCTTAIKQAVVLLVEGGQ